MLDGLLTALQLKLSHPTKHQLKLEVRRNFYALDLDSAIETVTDTCHTCKSLLKLPQTLIDQFRTHLPDAIGVTFAADVTKRNRQLIFVIRETVSSYTSTCDVESECHDALRDYIVRLCVEFRPLDGPPAVIHVDPGPGFIALVGDPALQRLGICLEVGRIKNPNKNHVAKKAVLEVEDKLLRQEPCGGPVSLLSLAIATAQLNSRIRGRGLSAREIWFQRDQFSNEQLPISDRAILSEQHHSRLQNHEHSQISKAPRGKDAPVPTIQVGDLVYIVSDRSKSQARARYLVTSIDNNWCYIRKFSGSQLRASSYKVKLSKCYLVRGHVSTRIPKYRHEVIDSDDTDDIGPLTIAAPPVSPLAITTETLVAPPNITTIPIAPPEVTASPEVPLMIAAPPEVEITAPAETSARDSARPIRRRQKPAYLQDYII